MKLNKRSENGDKGIIFKLKNAISSFSVLLKKLQKNSFIIINSSFLLLMFYSYKHKFCFNEIFSMLDIFHFMEIYWREGVQKCDHSI
jgi:hypothetical protein